MRKGGNRVEDRQQQHAHDDGRSWSEHGSAAGAVRYLRPEGVEEKGDDADVLLDQTRLQLVDVRD